MHYPHGVHRSNYFTTWRDGDWKVIYHTLPDTRTTGGHIQFSDGNYELFNLKEDPFEKDNLVADTAYADVVSNLSKRLGEWRKTTGDPLQPGN